MKTRIISGVVMGAIVAAVLTVGLLWESMVIVIGLAILCAVATYELLHNAAGIEDKVSLIGACILSAAAVVFYPFLHFFNAVATVYFIFGAFMVLKNHKTFSLAHIATLCALPVAISYAFFCLAGLAIEGEKLYALLLLLNVSSVCDMGAYFVGVTLGKHKLCPELSPKKTIEGAIGGIASSLIVSVILGICYHKNLLLLLPATIVLCIVGMVGDLFASSIKRSVGLKDYGNLIPGHGGILDRFDSILMISPLLFSLFLHGVI